MSCAGYGGWCLTQAGDDPHPHGGVVLCGARYLENWDIERLDCFDWKAAFPTVARNTESTWCDGLTPFCTVYRLRPDLASSPKRTGTLMDESWFEHLSLRNVLPLTWPQLLV
jgi:hypothetical protein